MSDYTNSGVLSRNKYKEEGSKQPDHRGKLNVEGKEYELAAWIRERENGEKFFSLKVSEPRQKTEQVTVPVVADNDIPF